MHRGKEEPATAAPSVVIVAASRALRGTARSLAEDLLASGVSNRWRIGLHLSHTTGEDPDALIVVGDPLDGSGDARLAETVERLDAAAVPVACLRSGGGGRFLDLDLPRDARVTAAVCLLETMWRSELRLAESRRREHRALEAVRRHEFELAEAAALQREFLPRHAMRGERFDCAVLWRPSRHVSGDIYDVGRLGRRHVGIFLADAVGHGVSAAILAMGLLRRLNLSTADGAPMRPAEVLGHLNAALLNRSAGATWFATAAYALLDVETGVLRVASAGHPPLLVERGDGGCERIDATGGLLGIFERERFDERLVQLRDGDRMLMHTDGLETLLGGADDYLDRLRSLARGRRTDELFTSLLARLETSGDEPESHDDLTVIGVGFGTSEVERLPSPAPMRMPMPMTIDGSPETE